MIRLLPILLLCSCAHKAPSLCWKDVKDDVDIHLKAGLKPEERIWLRGYLYEPIQCPDHDKPKGERVP